MKKTKFLTKKEALDGRKWYQIDATGQPVGRLASEVAVLLRGKHKPTFTPHNDCGDFVVIVNAEKVKFTGKKLTDKKYYHHSGYQGGLKEQTASEVLNKYPERVLQMAVKRMLPKTKLGEQIFTKLKVYKGEQHPHTAQKAENYTPKYI